MTPKRLIERMKEGYIPERRLEGGREVWRVGPDGTPCGAAVKQLVVRGLATGHYPHNAGYINLTDLGWGR